MKYEIDDETFNTVKQCDKSFECLSDDATCLCEVEKCVNRVIFTYECKDGKYCHFQQDYGDKLFCTCPVRKEIYNKYGE
jgi:hypothetical protein